MTYSNVKEAINEVGRSTLEDLIEQFGEDIVQEYMQQGYDINTMEEAYQGIYTDDEDFVQTLVEDVGDMPKDLPCYIHIDWEGTARDVMVDYFEIDGHYFRSL